VASPALDDDLGLTQVDLDQCDLLLTLQSLTLTTAAG
jgi:hypothetical protein